jgi:hypothetical protein
MTMPTAAVAMETTSEFMSWRPKSQTVPSGVVRVVETTSVKFASVGSCGIGSICAVGGRDPEKASATTQSTG